VELPKKANRKIKEGVVISDKMSKTVVVQTERKVRHPLYQKVIRISNTFKAHDEGETCSVGDTVRIMEVRPMSSDKRWVVIKVLGKKKEFIEDEDKGMPAPVRRVKETQSDTK
jgi:small subunit ribosomal protein S17